MAEQLRFRSSPGLVALGIVIGGGMVAPVPVAAQRSVQEIAQIAQQVTIQVNDGRSSGGSGVVIEQQPTSEGFLYRALTANHVVQGQDLSFQVQTTAGQSFGVTEVQPLRAQGSELDLAVVMFSSSQDLPVAQLGNSDPVSVGSSIYVVGYPALPGQTGSDRNLEFSPGVVTSRLNTPQSGGYALRYNAVTRGGMSGGPVFDDNGQVIGIHGQGDIAGAVQTATGDVEVLKTGFNAAIPIGAFVALLDQPGSGVALGLPDEDPVQTATLERLDPTPTEPVGVNRGPVVSMPAPQLLNMAFVGELKPYGIPFQDVLCRETASTTQRARVANEVVDAGINAGLISPSVVNESYLGTLSRELRSNCRRYNPFAD